MKLPPEIEQAFKDLVSLSDYYQLREIYDADFQKVANAIALHVFEEIDRAAREIAGLSADVVWKCAHAYALDRMKKGITDGE